MPDRTPYAARTLVQTGLDHGLTAEDCLRATGLAHLADDDLHVQEGQELQIARNLITALGDRPGLGVDAGRRTTLGLLGPWGFAVLTSPTFGDALTLAYRFEVLVPGFLEPELTGDAAEVRIVLSDARIPADVRDFFLERDLAAIAVLVPALVDDVPPGRLETRLEGERAAALRAVLPASVRLEPGRPRTVLAFPVAALTQPMPQANAATREVCESALNDLLDRRQRRTGTAAHVRARLLSDPAAMPSLAAVAAELHVDVRTLRRHLAAEGTSYRALREEVTVTLAIDLLETVGLSVEETARRLGYADATAFTHAFTRWTGAPPGHRRRAS